jgi:hypothetical protein
MVVKYIEKFMKFEEDKPEESNSNLNEDFLRQNGFM